MKHRARRLNDLNAKCRESALQNGKPNVLQSF